MGTGLPSLVASLGRRVGNWYIKRSWLSTQKWGARQVANLWLPNLPAPLSWERLLLEGRMEGSSWSILWPPKKLFWGSPKLHGQKAFGMESAVRTGLFHHTFNSLSIHRLSFHYDDSSLPLSLQKLLSQFAATGLGLLSSSALFTTTSIGASFGVAMATPNDTIFFSFLMSVHVQMLLPTWWGRELQVFISDYLFIFGKPDGSPGVSRTLNHTCGWSTLPVHMVASLWLPWYNSK